MDTLNYRKNIKTFSVISVILPLIAMNFCLFLFIILGSLDINSDNIDWNKKYISYGSDNTADDTLKFPTKSYLDRLNKIDWNDAHLFYNLRKPKQGQRYSFTNCSQYEFKKYIVLNDKKKILITKDNSEIIISAFKNNNAIGFFKEKTLIKNIRCIKNKKILNKILLNLPFLENILVKGKINNESGFTKVRSPYLYGEVSISRTARYYPANYVFKSLLILSSIFLFLYWKNNLNILKYVNNQKISNKFFYFGALSALFLTLHAIFLGISVESKILLNLRRLVIILFIVFEVVAQVLLTINLLKFKEKIIQYINPFILKIKIWFVAMVLLITSLSFTYIGFFNNSSAFNNILEWNYFAFLLIYYFLTRLLWK